MDTEALKRILSFGVGKGVSDVHLEVGLPPHMRLNGDLLAAKHNALSEDDTLEVARILLAEGFDDFKSSRRERDVTYTIDGASRFRASVFWQQNKVGVVLRVIPLEIKRFEDLNLPKVLQDICVARRGLILVTGATGNGKSTTLAAMLQRINETRRSHIVTIEDPIEFIYKKEKSLIIQREVGTDTPSFRSALSAALRQDPDVIMMGEVRDQETAEICLKAAETGHLVLTALHTPDTISTVQRLVGMFPSEESGSIASRMADALKAVVALRLLPAADGKWRVPAVEVMRTTRSIQECIRLPDKLMDLTQHIKNGRELYGMQTFDQHLLDLVHQKQITLEVAKVAASNPDEFERALTIE